MQVSMSTNINHIQNFNKVSFSSKKNTVENSSEGQYSSAFNCSSQYGRAMVNFRGEDDFESSKEDFEKELTYMLTRLVSSIGNTEQKKIDKIMNSTTPDNIEERRDYLNEVERRRKFGGFNSNATGLLDCKNAIYAVKYVNKENIDIALKRLQNYNDDCRNLSAELKESQI